MSSGPKPPADLTVTELRPAVLVGARMNGTFARALRERVLLDTTRGPLSLVWDEDAAEAVRLVLANKACGVFELAAEEPKTAAEVARALRDSHGLRVLRVPGRALRERLGVLSSRLGSSERARRELGYKPRCATTLDVVRRFLETVPRRLDPRLALFFRIVQLGAARASDVPNDARYLEARVHVALTGPGGEDLGVVLEQGRLRIVRCIPRPPTAVLTLKATTLLAMLGGGLDFSTAMLTGKVRVEGEALNALVLQGIVRGFREHAARGGAEGFAVRGLSKWFAKGVVT